MNKVYSISVFFLFIPLLSIGQNLYRLSVEELTSMLDTIAFDIELKVNVANELAYKLRDTQTSKAKFYATSAIGLADSISYSLGKSYSQVTLGLISKREKNIKLAENYFLKALLIRREISDNKSIASVYNNLGLLFAGNNSVKAQDYYELGLKTLEDLPQSSMKAVLHNNYGSFLTQEKDFNKALLHLDSSLVIRRNKNISSSLGNCHLNLASLYFEIDDSSQFNVYIDSSFFVFNIINDSLGKAKCYNLIGKYNFSKDLFDEARKNFEQAISFSENSIENKFRFSRNLAGVEVRNGKLDEALSINNECLAYFKAINNDREVTSLLINIGTIFYEKSEYQKAVEYYQKGIDKLENINDLGLESKALLFLSASYAYLGQLDKAANVHVDYLQIRELYFQQKSNSLNTILDEKDLLFQNAELKIAEVSNRLELEKKQTEKMRMQMILGGGVIFFLFLIALIGANFYRQRKVLSDLRIKDLLTENERNTNYIRLEEQENERNRIATDLHDRVGSMLTAIKFSMGFVESTMSYIQEDNKEHYTKVNKLIDDACDEVRNIAYDLKNSTLANFGLKTALESLVNSFAGKTPEIQLKVHNLDEHRLNNKIEVNAYLIIQEVISNVLKHAKAKKLVIQLNRFEDILNITAEDDGVGFIREKIKPGMGLNNIEARVYGLEGKFNLDSGKGNGTTIMIDIPINSIKIE